MSNLNWPQVQLLVGFAAGPSSAWASGVPANPVDIASRLWAAQGLKRGRNDEMAQTDPGSGTLTLDNRDGALDALNTSSPFYSAGVGGPLPYRQMVLRALWPPSKNLLPGQVEGTEFWQATGNSISLVSASYGQPNSGTTLEFVLPASSSATSWMTFEQPQPVTPGEQYTLSVYADNQSGQTVAPFVTFNTPFAANYSTVVGTDTLVSGASGRVSLTFTVPAGCYSMIFGLQGSGTTGAGSPYVYASCFQLEPGGSASSYVVGGTAYSRFTGFVERWGSGWQDGAGATGVCTASVVDYLALANRKQFYCAYAEQVMYDNPAVYYPMWEPSGALNAGNVTLSSSSVPALAPLPYGSGGSFAFGGSPNNSSSLYGDDGNTGLQLTAPVDGDQGAGVGLNVPVPGGANNFYAVEMWLQTTSASPNSILLSLNTANGKTQFVLMPSGTKGVLRVGGYLLGSTSRPAWTTVNCPFDDGNLHQIVVTRSTQGNQLAVQLIFDGAALGTWAVGAPTADWIGVGYGYNVNDQMFLPPGFTYYWNGPTAPQGFFTGIVKHLSVWTQSNGASIYWGSHVLALYGWSLAGNLQRTDQRLSTILGFLGYQGPTDLHVGETTEGPASNWTGQAGLQLMQQVQTDESGSLFVDRTGKLCLWTRTDRFAKTTNDFVLGDGGGTEIPYLEGLSFSADPTYLYNIDAISTMQSGMGGFPGVAGFIGTGLSAQVVNTASRGVYGPSVLEESVNYANSDPTIIYRAQFKSTVYGTPRSRVPSVTVDVGSNPSVFPTILGSDIGQRVTVNRRPFGAPEASLACFVEGVTEDIVAGTEGSPPSWQVQFDLSPDAYWRVAICNDSFYGVCDAAQTITAY